MKLYISGPISGYENKNKPAFEAAAKRVNGMGQYAITPFDLNVVDPQPYTDWVSNMKRDIKYLVGFDGVVVIDGWKQSKGANIEVALASWLNIPIYELNDEDMLVELLIDAKIELKLFTREEFLKSTK